MTPSKINTQIDRYQLLTLLGKGTAGKVYKAHDVILNREVAVKLIEWPNELEHSNWEQRFKREVQAVAHLSHPYIVKVYDVALEHDPPYMVMEYLTGQTFKERLQQGSLLWTDAITLILPITHALAYAHKKGVIHRDIKPANIILTEDGPKLLDFGLAQRQGSEKVTQTGHIIGTPAYMAPEQVLQSNKVDARVDVFAVGLILFECIAGYNPQARDSIGDTLQAAISYTPIDTNPLVDKIPSDLIDIIKQTLAKDSTQRYNSCKNLYDALINCFKQHKTPS